MKSLKTKNRAIVFLMALVFASSCKEQKTAKKETVIAKTMTLDEQVSEIMDMWPGTYNNDKQIAQLEVNGEDIWRVDNSGENGYLQLQSHYIKLNKPDIGKNVLYVEEYRDHQPDSTYRQRIYTILKIDSTNTIRVKMYPFKDKKKYIGAWRNIAVLDSLTTNEIIAFPDICDLIVKKNGSKYNMKMNGADCAFGTRVFNYEVLLSKSMFSYRDKITNAETDSTISTAANYAFHNLDRLQE